MRCSSRDAQQDEVRVTIADVDRNWLVARATWVAGGDVRFLSDQRARLGALVVADELEPTQRASVP